MQKNWKVKTSTYFLEHESTNLDPSEENHDGDGTVEDDLPIRQVVEVGVTSRIVQKVVQFGVYLQRSREEHKELLSAKNDKVFGK